MWPNKYLLCSTGGLCSAQQAFRWRPNLHPGCGRLYQQAFTEWNSPGGTAVTVVRMDGHGGWLVETKGYGFAKAAGTKVGPETIFAIGSKLFDPYSWDTTTTSVILNWKLLDPVVSAQSTITDLMAPPYWPACARLCLLPHNDTIPAVYNNIVYAVLSYLPTTLLLGNSPFARYVAEHILGPLGLPPPSPQKYNLPSQ
ncbi:hypothetical protein B0H14DRAFT_3715957 [Mycena olivaceomarginata]|nr:hypothetical protein B0H14DRAFT_3715957 [Mycena olivaceomarginata]